ncbi:class I lanthipeptide [Chitinophaga sp. CB10]|uniref:class I lanthipeptide n=1 Tax=Chitinophaga sp. CB10 TaxID=1891659 RepID=UPI0025BE2EA3|nr:class I lanthipeptide [Chitinophaga sp. CB10]
MKKKKISLEKKLSLKKTTVAELSKTEQKSLAGGAATQYCNTYDPQETCETHPRPGYQCV